MTELSTKFADYNTSTWKRHNWNGWPALVPPNRLIPFGFVFDQDPPRALNRAVITAGDDAFGEVTNDREWNTLLADAADKRKKPE